MEIKEKILTASFFHDIGKFQQRGIPLSERLQHTIYSGGFVNKYFSDDLINAMVLNHHQEEINKSNLTGEKRILAELVCEADNLASNERQPDPNVREQQPLESIFSKVDYGKNQNLLFLQNITKQHYDDYIFPVTKKEYDTLSENLESEYRDHWLSFEKDFEKVKNEEIETKINLSKKYLWSIPSSSYRTRSDVSLYEHAKITSAIAICIYDWMKEQYQDISKFDKIFNREEERYLLILGDITGIQKYIYNVGHTGAAKALKGRSFYLQQMLDNISYWMLGKKFNLPVTNLIYSSGGKFYILAPNTSFVKQALSEVQSELENKLINEYGNNLGIIFGHIVLKGKDLEYDKTRKQHLISEKWDELNKVVEINKKRKLSFNWDYSYFVPQGPDGDVLRCSATGKELIKKETLEQIKKEKVSLSDVIHFFKYETDQCVFYEELDDNQQPTGDYIAEEQYICRKIGQSLKQQKKEVYIYDSCLSQSDAYSVLGVNSFSVGNKLSCKDITRKFHINEFELSGNDQNTISGYKFYGGNWKFDSYSEVIKKGVGIERLGVLRLDVDNLGKIFKEGFAHNATFSRIVQLSSMLDYFFSHYLNKLSVLYWTPTEGIIDKNEISTNEKPRMVRELIEIVYSGGDDVFIVGHWSVLPDVAIWINNEFKKYTCHNPNFSISAGIALFDDKYPIYKSAISAGDFENSAKRISRNNKNSNSTTVKDGICFLDIEIPVSWNDFKAISEKVKNIYRWIELGRINTQNENKKISKGFISRLYFISNEYKIMNNQNWSKWRWRAAYSLSRFGNQYKDFKREIDEFSANLFLNHSTEQDFIRILSIIAKWAELLIRKREN